jgi:hypothetical protein
MNIFLSWTQFSNCLSVSGIWVVWVRLRKEKLYVSVTAQSILQYSHYISIITIYQVALLYCVGMYILEHTLNPGGLTAVLVSTA